MKILRSIAGLLCVCGLLVFPSCNKSSPTAVLGDWTKQTPFFGIPRAGAVSFTIGTKAYVGLGFNGNVVSPNPDYPKDFWVYDVQNNIWDSVAPFPGLGREQAVAFSLNGKGYVGTGFNRDSLVYLRDFWEFDPTANTYGQWTRLKDFHGAARTNAVAFDDGTYGYLGTGYNSNYFIDFYQYNPTLDSWNIIASPSGDKRQQAMTMTINGKTYLFGGVNNGSFTFDMWEFDPAELALGHHPWTNRTPLTTDAQYNNFRAAVNRYDAVAFTLNNKGYISTGSNGSILNTTWQYDPSNQTFTLMTPFERFARSQAVAFVLGNETIGYHGFVSTGSQGNNYFDDMMEFLPLNAYVLNN